MAKGSDPAQESLGVMGDTDPNFPGESKGRMDDGNLCSLDRRFVPNGVLGSDGISDSSVYCSCRGRD